MDVHLNAVILPEDQISQAFPLVQVTWPEIDMAAWRDYVQFFRGRTGKKNTGVIAIRDSDNYVCGVLVYEVERDIKDGLQLTVHLLTAADLANSDEPLRALLVTAERTAQTLNCRGLQIRPRPEQSAMNARLKLLGLDERARFLWKRILPAQPVS